MSSVHRPRLYHDLWAAHPETGQMVQAALQGREWQPFPQESDRQGGDGGMEEQSQMQVQVPQLEMQQQAHQIS